MTTRMRIGGAALALCGLLCGFAASAAGPSFKIVSMTLHADAPAPEVCVTFNAPVVFPAREGLAEKIILKREDKRQKIEPRTLSFSEREFCLQELAPRARYTLSLPGFLSVTGQRIAASRPVSFILPDRKPALGFVSLANTAAFPAYGEKTPENARSFLKGFRPLLRSVNVPNARLTLYKLERRETFVLAWQKFRQSVWAQSESLIYAREKGRKIFESDLVFRDTPNEPQILEAPLPPDGTLSPGLYYIAAAPAAVGARDPGLLAGQWFLVSSWRLAARQERGGVRVDVLGPQTEERPQASIFLMDEEGGVVGEEKVSASGSTFFVSSEKKTPRYVLMQSAEGVLDLLDLVSGADAAEPTVPENVFFRTDSEMYAPGQTAFVLFGGKLPGKSGGKIKLLRPGGGIYSEQFIPAFTDVATADVSLPITRDAGAWTLVWQAEDGEELARREIRFSQSGQPVHLQGQADRKRLGRDGVVVLSVETSEGFQKGRALVRPTRPENAGWKEFVFGLSVDPTPASLADVSFMTGADGHGSLTLNLDKTAASLQAIEIVLSLNNQAGDVRIVLPAPDSAPLVGVAPLPRESFLPGTEQAAFNVIALDDHGRRVARNDLYYTIIEEGRRFEWVPLEGYWGYRPLPSRHRVGGGPLSLSSQADNVLSWPVTPGRYSLEIADGTGKLLARYGFEGRLDPVLRDRSDTLSSRPKEESAGAVVFSELSPTQAKGRKATFSVRFKGVALAPKATAVLITRFIPDDVRQPVSPARVFHVPLDARGLGQGTLDLPTQEGTVKVYAVAGENEARIWGETTFPSRLPLSITGDVPERLTVSDRVDVRFALERQEGGEISCTYAFETPPGLEVRGAAKGSFRLKKGERKALPFSFLAQRPLNGSISLTLAGGSGCVRRKAWPLSVLSQEQSRQMLSFQRLAPGESLDVSAYGPSFFSPLEAGDPLPVLEDLMRQVPETTQDIARWIEATNLWGSVLVDFALVQDGQLAALQQEKREALSLRQKGEGCLTAFDDQELCDVAATAQAVGVLPSGPVRAAAEEWLASKLQNAWIGESERETRAMVFEALARLDRADLSALHYFAQTSEGKPLSALATASLGLAFAGRADEQSRRWVSRTLSSEQPATLDVLRILAMNDTVKAQELEQALKKAAFETSAARVQDPAGWLVVYARAAAKEGSWRFRIGDAEQKTTGILSRKGKAGEKKDDRENIKNMSERTVLIGTALPSASSPAQEKEKHPSARRTLYRTDGRAVGADESLVFGETYLLVVAVDPGEEKIQRLVFPKADVFQSVTFEPGDSTKRLYPWLSGSPSKAEKKAATPWADGFGVSGDGPWQMAFLITPRYRGRFEIPAPLWQANDAGQKPFGISELRKSVQ